MSLKKIPRINPPGYIGIIGGGQLGRMMTFTAKRMGYNVIVLDPKPNSPAGQVADQQIIAPYTDIKALRELGSETDVLTYEFEHIDANLLSELEQDGYAIYPSAKTLKSINNKFHQKSILQAADIAVPRFYRVSSLIELKEAFKKSNQRIVLKTCSGGYDGKGNIIIKSPELLDQAYDKFRNHQMMAEEYIDYEKEISIIIAKNDEGVSYYPIVENFHQDSILIKSIIPAQVTTAVASKVKLLAKKVADVLDDYGVFCIEMFLDKNSNILVNEIAPRPHNSGHYTIEGCITSQFEQLIRIITGMPMGSTELRSPAAMYNILGYDQVSGVYSINGIESVLNIKDCHLHLYGKSESHYLRKIGHITALGSSGKAASAKAKKALESIKTKFIGEYL